MNAPTNGSPSRPITAPKPPRPPTLPKPKPRRIHDAERAHRERELDARIEAVGPAMARFDSFLLANGIQPRELLCGRAMAIWSGRPMTTNNQPRRWIF